MLDPPEQEDAPILPDAPMIQQPVRPATAVQSVPEVQPQAFPRPTADARPMRSQPAFYEQVGRAASVQRAPRRTAPSPYVVDLSAEDAHL